MFIEVSRDPLVKSKRTHCHRIVKANSRLMKMSRSFLVGVLRLGSLKYKNPASRSNRRAAVVFPAQSGPSTATNLPRCIFLCVSVTKKWGVRLRPKGGSSVAH